MGKNSLKSEASIEIDSVSNQRIKDIVRLRRRVHRDKAGLLLIEGYRELVRALDAGIVPRELYFCEGLFLGENEGSLLAKAKEKGAVLISLSEAPFRKISYRDRPDGLIATAPRIGASLEDLKLTEKPLIVIAEAIEKPGNLGGILRSADAVKADAVIVCDPTTDINNPNVVRASTGTLFTVPVVETGAAEAFEWLRSNDIRLLAATPHADKTYSEVDLTQACAVAVGAEQFGLSDEWLDHADYKVRIPMLGAADSLNVATATSILLFEAARQRGFR